MITTNDILKAIDDGGFSKQDLVSILELSISKLDIDTVSGMARSEKKTAKGIRKSNCYRKIKFNAAVLVVKGVRDCQLPF